MTKAACLSITIALFLSGVAHADPGTQDQDKSESVAIGLSTAGTLVGPALIGAAWAYGERSDSALHPALWPMLITGSAAAILGPSLGEWYAGQRYTRGLAIRLAGGALLGGGAAMLAGLDDTGDRKFEVGEGGVGVLLAIAGGAAVAIGSLIDIHDAPAAVRDHNRTRVRIGVAPTAIGHRGQGLALVGTF